MHPGPSGRHRSPDSAAATTPTPTERPEGPVPQDGDSWSTADASSPPVTVSARSRTRAASTAVGAAAFAGIVLAVALPRGCADPPRTASPPGPLPPSATARTPDEATSVVASATATGARASTHPANTATVTHAATAGTVATGAAGAPPTVGATGPAEPSATTSTAPPAPLWTSRTVAATTVLRRGDAIATNRTTLSMSSDGDLLIVDENNTVRWRSGTSGSGDHAVFQADGNFVVYDAGNATKWKSNTPGHNGAVLVLKTNGDVCVTFNGVDIWSAGTAH